MTTTTTAAGQLAAISRDLDTTGEAWQAAGYPWDGPVWEAREAVFARLRQWNDEDPGGAGVAAVA
jgi:hypothetical protein